MCYFQIISRKLYAVVISLIDGFIGVIPLSLLLTHFMGINGMWLAFPLLAFLMLSGIIVTNCCSFLFLLFILLRLSPLV